MSLVVVTGLAAEARIAIARAEARIAIAKDAAIVGAGRANRLSDDLEAAIASGARRLLSFGVAGALVPQLRSGDLVLAHGVRDGEDSLSCDPDWRVAMSNRLQCPSAGSGGDHGVAHASEPYPASLFRYRRNSRCWLPILDGIGRYASAEMAGADAPVAEAISKNALSAATGAVAVDMESVVVARAAQRHGLPFAILRVVADPAQRSLPSAALVAMRADGEVDVSAVFSALSRNPGQLPTLARLALDARRAFSALARARAFLGADFASFELEQLRPAWREKAASRRSQGAALGSAVRGYAHDMA
jgi:adenosylhomocysteine nucleosidase